MERTLELQTQWGTTEKVQLEISNYMNNNGLYIGLSAVGGEYPESYGDVTVNLDSKAPDYCSNVDTNNMPELKNFIKDHDLGEFTGLSERSGFYEFPLYMFNPDKLRELCPDGMATYENSIGVAKKLEQKTPIR